MLADALGEPDLSTTVQRAATPADLETFTAHVDIADFRAAWHIVMRYQAWLKDQQLSH